MALVEDGLAPLGHLPVGRGEIDLLEGPGAQYLRLDLARDRQRRCPIHVGVPEARQEVRGSGAGNREAGRGAAGQLSVRRHGKGGGPFVADPVEAEPARLLLAAKRIGHAEVGVADHAKDVAHTPVGHGLDQEVAHRPHVWFLSRDSHVDAVVAGLDLEGADAVVEARRLARQRGVVPPVPRAAQEALLDRALPERAALVGTAIVEGSVLPLEVGHGQAPVSRRDRRDPTFRQLVQVEHPIPAQLAVRGGAHPSLLSPGPCPPSELVEILRQAPAPVTLTACGSWS